MREIKFRAFFAGKMYAVTHILVDPRTGAIEKAFLSEDGEHGWGTYAKMHEDTFSLMQFTGLRDKHGTEIYEGDIVDASLAWNGGTLPTMGVVEFSDEFAGLGLRNHGGHTLFHNHIAGSFNVVGNIHQNPELLR